MPLGSFSRRGWHTHYIFKRRRSSNVSIWGRSQALDLMHVITAWSCLSTASCTHTQSLTPMSIMLVPKQCWFWAPPVDLIPDGKKYPHTPLLPTSMQLASFRCLEHCLMAVEEESSGTKLISVHIWDNPADSQKCSRSIFQETRELCEQVYESASLDYFVSTGWWGMRNLEFTDV